MMQFESWADFWAMGGYAFYVWLSFGVALGAIALITIFSVIEHKRLIKQVVTEQQRKLRIQRAQQQARNDTTEPDRSN